MKRFASSKAAQTLAPALLSIGLAFFVASLVLLVSGYSPVKAYRAMWKNLANLDGLITMINVGARYYIAAIAVAIALKMNVFNIGTNGQYQLGAMFGAVTGAALNLPRPLHVAITLLVAMGSAALWASLIAVLQITRKVNPVLTGIMLNGVGSYLITYLMQSKWTHFRDPGLTEYGSTRKIPPSGRLGFLGFGKHLNETKQVVYTAQLQSFVLVALFVGILFYVLVYKTRFGFELRASGGNPSAARSAGINPKKMILISMLLSGACAGLIGMGIVLSSNDQLTYGDRFPASLGFTGIGIALLGRNHPLGVGAAALLWAGLDQAARGLVPVNIPGEVAVIMQGALLFIAVIVYAVSERKALAATIRDAASRTHGAAV